MTVWYKIILASKATGRRKEILVELACSTAKGDYFAHEARAKAHVLNNFPKYTFSDLDEIDGWKSTLFLFPTRNHLSKYK